MQQSKFLRTKLAAAAAALLLVAGVAWADPPSQAIRLAYISGPVSFLPAGETQWVEARINRPLWTGDRLWTDRAARAELQIGGAAFFFAPETNASILNFDDQRTQIEVTQGTVYVNVRSLATDDAIEIDTPNLAFVVRRPGTYRIEVRADGESTAVAVERGEAEAFGRNAAYVVRAGERFRFFGADLTDYAAEPLYARAPFDNWVAERLRYRERSTSARYVSQDTIGYADLDAYGTWRTVASYGPVWVPTRVDTGWAPYRYGHWAWVDPWGWTWIDDAPWGFAPFHYGRWAYVDNRYWGWVPGPRNVRPVYAPALVAFVGGDNFSITVSSGPAGGVAWFPLAPGEVYRPAYTASRDYFTKVNVTNTVVNVTNVTNVYNNPRITDVRYVNVNNVNAVTAVPTQAFVQAQPVQRAAVRVDREALQRTTVTAGASVAPARASVAGGARAAQARPTAQVMERQVVAKSAPPAPPPSIERRQDAMKQNPGTPLDRADLAKIAPTQAVKPNVRVVDAAPAAKSVPAAPPRRPEAQAGQQAQTPADQRAQPPQAQDDRERATRGERAQRAPEPAAAAPTPAQPPLAQPAPARPEPAAKAPEPARPTQAASAPEPPQRGQPQRAPESPAAKAPEPARPTQAAPAPEPPQRGQPQRAPEPPAAKAPEPARPTQAAPVPEPPQRGQGQRAPEPPAAKAPEPARPTQAAPAPEPPQRGQGQRAPEPPAAKAPEPARPAQAAPAPEPPQRGQAQRAPEQQAARPAPATPPAAQDRRAEREAARAPGKDDEREGQEKGKGRRD